MAAAQTAVGNLLGISFGHYISMTYANVEKLLQYFDSSLQFTLTEDLDCRDGEYFIKMSSGRYTLTPKQAVDILRYQTGSTRVCSNRPISTLKSWRRWSTSI